MNTPHDVAQFVIDTFGGTGTLVTYSDGFIDIDYEHNHKHVKIFIEPDGWDIYTTLHGLIWGGNLQQLPTPDVIDKVKGYLSTFK